MVPSFGTPIEPVQTELTQRNSDILEEGRTMHVSKPLVPRQMQIQGANMKKLTKIEAKDQDEVQDITDDNMTSSDPEVENAPFELHDRPSDEALPRSSTIVGVERAHTPSATGLELRPQTASQRSELSLRMGNKGFIVKNGEPQIDFLDPARAGSPDEAKLLREEYLKVKAELELLKSSQHNTRAKSRERSANFARTETAGDRGEPARAAGSTTPGGRRASPKRSGRATV